MESVAVVWREYTGSDRDVALRVPFAPDGFLNATAMADGFGKRVYDWLRTERAIDYIRAAHKRIFGGELSCPAENVRFAQDLHTPLVVTRKGGLLGEQGTWLHPKVAIEFARWISPDFALWCDSKIEEILRANGPFPLRASDETALAPVHPESQLLATVAAALDAGFGAITEALRQIGPEVTVAKDAALSLHPKVDGLTALMGDVHTRMVKDNGKRSNPDAKDTRKAIATVARRYSGKCPCCRRVAILTQRGDRIPDGSVWDHFRDRSSKDPKHGWYVCEPCNKYLGPPNGNSNRKEAEPRFLSYQYDFGLVCEEMTAEAKKKSVEVTETEDAMFLPGLEP